MRNFFCEFDFDYICKKVLAWARSKEKICLGCARTGLAATIYETSIQLVSFFKYPVLEDDDDRDEANIVECQLSTECNPKRLKLLQAAAVIVWDEFLSNHRELFEAVHRALNNFLTNGKVCVAFGDLEQIAPVVPHGSR